MLRHTMGVVKQILLKINPQQPIVLTADQPVYALGKQVQWMCPEFYGESNVVMMMGALHIEMAFLNTIGDWLEGSGWVEVLALNVQDMPIRCLVQLFIYLFKTPIHEARLISRLIAGCLRGQRNLCSFSTGQP